jgi:hypothetical protein
MMSESADSTASRMRLAPLLNRLHDDQANHDADERDECDADEAEEHGLPGTEIKVSHRISRL